MDQCTAEWSQIDSISPLPKGQVKHNHVESDENLGFSEHTTYNDTYYSQLESPYVLHCQLSHFRRSPEGGTYEEVECTDGKSLLHVTLFPTQRIPIPNAVILCSHFEILSEFILLCKFTRSRTRIHACLSACRCKIITHCKVRVCLYAILHQSREIWIDRCWSTESIVPFLNIPL